MTGVLKMQTPSEVFPEALNLVPTSRRPTTLPAETIRTMTERPFPRDLGCDGRLLDDDESPPTASIIVVTFDNLIFTRMCLESVLGNTADVDFELIVVDNGSTDGSVEYLKWLEDAYAHVRLVANACNRGFALANNQGVAAASGNVLVLLNNDTMTPPGWLSRLLGHLSEPSIGLVGPVTNRSGSESQIDVPYSTYGGLLEFSENRYHQHRGEQLDVPSLVMFCVALRRDIWDEVGPLDERFEVGLFEDDDYAVRVKAAGYRVVCAEDAFVHHFGQASIGKLSASGIYGPLFHANRQRWEEKWGQPWAPHGSRPKPEYRSLVERVRAVARTAIPADATVAVVSKGDEDLLDLNGRRAWHFPRASDGSYAGHYPRDDSEAIAHLQALRGRGAEYLVLPRTAFWWLNHYPAFQKYLDLECRQVSDEPDTCAVFALTNEPPGTVATTEESANA